METLENKALRRIYRKDLTLSSLAGKEEKPKRDTGSLCVKG